MFFTDLIFVIFLHKCTFWAQFFSTWKRVNCGKISQNFSKYELWVKTLSVYDFLSEVVRKNEAWVRAKVKDVPEMYNLEELRAA